MEPAAQPASDATQRFEQPRRGLALLQIAYIIALLAAVFGGALRASLMDQIRRHDGSLTYNSLSMLVLSGGLQVIMLIGAVLLILGATSISRAPKEARVAELCRTFMILTGVVLVMRLLSPQLPVLLGRDISVAQLGQVMAGVGFIEAAIDLAALIVLCEAILRLRRCAAPGDRAVVDNEGLVRGGLIGAMVARLTTLHAGYAIGAALAMSGLSLEWTAYLVRVPFSVLVYGALLWLLHSTEQLFVRQRPAVLGAHDT